MIGPGNDTWDEHIRTLVDTHTSGPCDVYTHPDEPTIVVATFPYVTKDFDLSGAMEMSVEPGIANAIAEQINDEIIGHLITADRQSRWQAVKDRHNVG